MNAVACITNQCVFAPKHSCIGFELATPFNYSQVASLSAFHPANFAKKMSVMPHAQVQVLIKPILIELVEKILGDYKLCLLCIS